MTKILNVSISDDSFEYLKKYHDKYGQKSLLVENAIKQDMIRKKSLDYFESRDYSSFDLFPEYGQIQEEQLLIEYLDYMFQQFLCRFYYWVSNKMYGGEGDDVVPVNGFTDSREIYLEWAKLYIRNGKTMKDFFEYHFGSPKDTSENLDDPKLQNQLVLDFDFPETITINGKDLIVKDVLRRWEFEGYINNVNKIKEEARKREESKLKANSLINE